MLFNLNFFIINIIFLLGMATMKEDKGKEVMDEVVRQVESQPRPFVGEKRKVYQKELI